MTSVPDFGEPVETRLPRMSATDVIPAPLRTITWVKLVWIRASAWTGCFCPAKLPVPCDGVGGRVGERERHRVRAGDQLLDVLHRGAGLGRGRLDLAAGGVGDLLGVARCRARSRRRWRCRWRYRSGSRSSPRR